MPFIAATATAFPSHYYDQEELLGALREVWKRKYFNIDRIEKFHRNVTVSGRHLALPIEDYANLGGFGASNDAFLRVAPELGARTLGILLDKVGMQAGDIQLLATTTVTGIAVPSLEARLMNRLPFSTQTKRLPLFGLGCMGGAAGVARVSDYLKGHPTEAAILLSVELCSLTLQTEDLSTANLISSGLFGDGAGAVLMVGDQHPLATPDGVQVQACRSTFFPDTERVMGWDIGESGFKVVLSPTVPDYAGDPLRVAVEEFLHDMGLSSGDIQHWICHPGGPKVIQSIEESLNLSPDALEPTRESLRRDGNMSSASVLFILQDYLDKRFEPGEKGVLLAMGPAFSAEAVLLEHKKAL